MLVITNNCQTCDGLRAVWYFEFPISAMGITQYLHWCFLIDVYHATENYVTIISVVKKVDIKENIWNGCLNSWFKQKNITSREKYFDKNNCYKTNIMRNENIKFVHKCRQKRNKIKFLSDQSNMTLFIHLYLNRWFLESDVLK